MRVYRSRDPMPVCLWEAFINSHLWAGRINLSSSPLFYCTSLCADYLLLRSRSNTLHLELQRHGLIRWYKDKLLYAASRMLTRAYKTDKNNSASWHHLLTRTSRLAARSLDKVYYKLLLFIIIYSFILDIPQMKKHSWLFLGSLCYSCCVSCSHICQV